MEFSPGKSQGTIIRGFCLHEMLGSMRYQSQKSACVLQRETNNNGIKQTGGKMVSSCIQYLVLWVYSHCLAYQLFASCCDWWYTSRVL